MPRKKRSSSARGRISVDVGDMKKDIEWAAKELGITVSQIIRDAFRAYARREDGGISTFDLSSLLLDLEILRQKFVRFRDDPTDPQAADEFQLAMDWVIVCGDGLWRWMPR